MDNVWVLRLDQAGGLAPGNKVFKLRHHLSQARKRGVDHVLSFGGAWSNHLHALAAVGAELGLRTTAIVRGGENDTAMLQDARGWGMNLVPVTRQEYRRRHDTDYQRQIMARFHPCLLVPEGGGGPEGVRGCLDIATLVNQLDRQWSRVVVAVGTGTTMAGLAAGLSCANRLVGISALKGAGDLDRAVGTALAEAGLQAGLPWEIIHDFHCGGFARTNETLRKFLLEFEHLQGLALDPVYTAKALLGIHAQLASGCWSRTDPVLFIHTGGLQGRRGYSWLEQPM